MEKIIKQVNIFIAEYIMFEKENIENFKTGIIIDGDLEAVEKEIEELKNELTKEKKLQFELTKDIYIKKINIPLNVKIQSKDNKNDNN